MQSVKSIVLISLICTVLALSSGCAGTNSKYSPQPSVDMASVVRVLLDTSTFETYFGPTLVGLGLTVLAATIIEVCSEGSAPLAADLVTRGGAPGNGFAFLMAGASTDYTEVMVLKDCTRSWKFALFLPLVTLPQVLLIGWLLNTA